MSLPSRGAWIAIAILAGIVAVSAWGWMREHDARMEAESATAQQDKQIGALKQLDKQTQLMLAARLAALEKQKKAPVTALQFADEAKQIFPNLPKDLQVQSIPVNAALPDGPKSQAIVVPQEDLGAIRDAQLTCQQNVARLSACESTESDERQQLKLTAAERDEWRVTAKGGTFWHRTLGAAKWFAIGAGTGAAAYAVSHHR